MKRLIWLLLVASGIAHAAPTWVGSGTPVSNAVVGNLTVTCPAALVDDLRLITEYRDGEATRTPTSSGTFTVLFTPYTNVTLYGQKATGSDTAAVTINNNTGNEIVAACHIIRGVATADLSTIIDSSNQRLVSSQTILGVPARTPTVDGTLAIYMGGSRNPWTSVTAPTNFTEAIDFSGPHAGMSVDYWIQTTAAAVALQDLVITGNASVSTQSGALIFLKPAPATGPIITTVSGDNVMAANESNVLIVGTNFGAAQGTGSVKCVDGAITSTFSTNSWTATSISVNSIQGNCRFDAARTILLTVNGGATATRAVAFNPVSGHSYVDVTTLNTLTWGGFLNLVPTRLTTKGWPSDPTSDKCANASQFEIWMSAGTGSITPQTNGSVTAIASTVRQLTFRCHNGTSWAPNTVWDIGGL